MKQKEFEIMNSTIFVKRNKFRYNKIGENMLSIEKSEQSIYEIQRSKFITTLYRIDSLEEIETNLQAIKEKYRDANHHCYAYILEEKKKCSDDGEPSGTAGMPILNVLEQHHLDHILCIVTRYFGGIKLGAGGLVRAYSKSATIAIENATIISLEHGYEMKITFPYSYLKTIDFLLKNYWIKNKNFQDEVTYQFEITKQDYLILSQEWKNDITNEIIIKETWVPKNK